jgi:hypothetical protein
MHDGLGQGENGLMGTLEMKSLLVLLREFMEDRNHSPNLLLPIADRRTGYLHHDPLPWRHLEREERFGRTSRSLFLLRRFEPTCKRKGLELLVAQR